MSSEPVTKFFLNPHIVSLSFLIIVFTSLISCKNDPKLTPDEVQYFEDYVSPEGKWGFINKSGDPIIGYTYDAVRDFSEGLCAVNYQGKWGYIDTRNTFVINPQFKAAWPVKNNRAHVKFMNDDIGILHMATNHMDTLQEFDQLYPLSDQLYKMRQGDLFGILGADLKPLIPCAYKSISEPTGAYFIARDKNGYTIINKSNTRLVDGYYDRIYPITSEVFYTEKDRKSYLIHIPKKTITAFPKLINSPFISGVAPFSSFDLNGLINLKGEIIIEPIYDEIMPANEMKWITLKNNTYGIIDNNGHIVAENKYEMMHQYSEGKAAVRHDGLWGFIDTLGAVVIWPEYVLVWDFKEDRAQVLSDKKLGFISPSGQYFQTTGYFEARSFSEDLCAVQEWM